MRTLGGRTKKLAIAFWLSRHPESGWKCADCRTQRLERERNCGYLGLPPSRNATPVWAGGNLVLDACPKPMVSGESVALLEAHSLWCLYGRPMIAEQSARSLDAFLWIERLQKEQAAAQEASGQRAFAQREAGIRWR